MATQAYVVYATPGKVEETTKAIAKFEVVKSAHPCWGRSDVIALVGGVEATDTRIVVEV